jgi:hypothetical protein
MPPSSMSAARHRLPGKGLAVVLGLGLAIFSTATRAAPPAGAEDGATQHAKELFQQGSTLFNLGDFDKAIEAWQAGYKEKPDPTFLYNIGQAYRLKGDATKALFFYRGYLRNAPKGAFRAEVEGKIAALQKGGESKPATPPPAPPPAATPPPATPAPATPPPVVAPPQPSIVPGPKPVAPPPVEAPPIPEPMSPPSDGRTGDVGPTPPPPLTEGEVRNRPIDLQFALGFAKFTSGVNVRGSVPAQLAVDLAVGYTFGAADAPVRFRLGAFFGSTSLVEKTTPSNKIGFATALLEPSVRIRVVPRRASLVLGVGFGVLGVSNLKVNSVLLAKGQARAVNGTIPLFETRFAAGVQIHLSPAFMLTATPAFSISPKGTGFYGPIGRFELMFGVGYSF